MVTWLLRRVVPCAVGWSVLLCAQARGDSWFPPGPKRADSANGRFRALSEPAKGGSPARLTVYEIIDAKPKPERRELWSAELANEPSPQKLLVSDDGAHVVTFDDWPGHNRGEHAVVFYDRTGLRRRHALEQVLGLELRKRIPFGRLGQRAASPWRTHSIVFFDEGEDAPPGTPRRLCVWLGWCDLWLAWDVPGGDPVDPDDALRDRWYARAREWALAQDGPQADHETACSLLARLGYAEDRPLVERRLEAPIPTGYVSQWVDGKALAVVHARSPIRQHADELLARWDGRRPRREPHSVYLGRFYAKVRLPDPPVEGDGSVRAYLFDESVESDGWADATPACEARVEFDSFPTARPRGTEVSVRMDTLTPGRYWLKAVYDRAAPFCGRDEVVCRPGHGDRETTARRVVEVRAGEVVDAGDFRL